MQGLDFLRISPVTPNWVFVFFLPQRKLGDRSLAKMADAEWDAVMKVHVYGTYNVVRAAWPHLREQR